MKRLIAVMLVCVGVICCSAGTNSTGSNCSMIVNGADQNGGTWCDMREVCGTTTYEVRCPGSAIKNGCICYAEPNHEIDNSMEAYLDDDGMNCFYPSKTFDLCKFPHN